MQVCYVLGHEQSTRLCLSFFLLKLYCRDAILEGFNSKCKGISHDFGRLAAVNDMAPCSWQLTCRRSCFFPKPCLKKLQGVPAIPLSMPHPLCVEKPVRLHDMQSGQHPTHPTPKEDAQADLKQMSGTTPMAPSLAYIHTWAHAHKHVLSHPLTHARTT